MRTLACMWGRRVTPGRVVVHLLRGPVLHHVTMHLSVHDVACLAATCKGLRAALLHDSRLWRRFAHDDETCVWTPELRRIAHEVETAQSAARSCAWYRVCARMRLAGGPVGLETLRRMQHRATVAEHVTCKVVLVGDASVGKSALSMRYVNGEWNPHFVCGIGVDFGTRLEPVRLSRKQKLVLQTAHPSLVEPFQMKVMLWDTAGQERYQALRSVYLEATCAVLVCFDVTRASTLASVRRVWAPFVRSHPHAHPMAFLVACKADCRPSQCEVTAVDAAHVAVELGFVGVWETSAKTGDGVRALFSACALHCTNQFMRHVETYVPPSAGEVRASAWECVIV